ncbi:MAG: hypothetical protein PHG85_06660 [Candidatus Altiarchaeota archaeon]|nr:hypothetical protein [Candidatus Altiarchaeota archaeon]
MAEGVDGRRRYALALIVALGVCTLIAPLYARFVVDVFAIGYSDVKILVFPVFALLAHVFYFAKPKNDAGYGRQAKSVLLLSAILYAAGIASFMLLVYGSGLNGFFRHYAVRDGFLSSNSLDHIHSFKPVIGWPLILFPEASYYFDFGYAFTSYIPFYAYIPFTVLLMCLAYLLCRLLPGMGSRLEHSVSGFLLFSISIFTVLKSIVDGGFFNTQLTIPAAFLVYILAFHTGNNRRKNAALLLAAAISFAMLQLSAKLFLTAVLNRGLTIDMAMLTASLYVSDENIYASAALYLIIWLSFRPLDKNPGRLKLAYGIIVFIALYAGLVYVANARGYYGSSLVYSSDLLSRSRETVDANTSISVLSRHGSIPEGDFYVVTHAEQLRRDTVIWLYTNRTTQGAEIIGIGGTPPGRRNQKAGCGHNPIEYEDTVIFKLYDFKYDAILIESPLLSIEKTGVRDGEYVAKMRYCTPNKQIVLLEVLSQYDDNYIAELVSVYRKTGEA